MKTLAAHIITPIDVYFPINERRPRTNELSERWSAPLRPVFPKSVPDCFFPKLPADMGIRES